MTNLLYTDIEDSLREAVRAVLDRRLSPQAVAAIADAPETDFSVLWGELARDVGVAALLVPEELGGAGAGPREAAVVLEELARAVAPVPFLTSAVVATAALVAVQDRSWLPKLAAGEHTAALVVPWSARAGAWGPALDRPEGLEALDGPGAGGSAVAPVAGAVEADVFLVPTVGSDGQPQLRALGRDQVAVSPLATLDMSRRLAEVSWSGDGEILATGPLARDAVDGALGLGAALLASEQYALARHCLEATVAYARTRIQFARPIGSFQALKHRLADVYLEVVQAQAAARYAADTWATGDPDRHVAVAVAQSFCSEAAVHAAEEALQLHGGIGMTWEHPAHLWLKRAKSDAMALGTPTRHRAELARLVDLA